MAKVTGHGVSHGKLKIAILDDYQNVPLDMADWTPVAEHADITVFNDHIAHPEDLVDRLAAFDVIFVMRERTPLPRSIIERLPRLRMIASTGPFNASIDMSAAADHGIHVATTGGTIASTVELTWALILAASRNLVVENTAVRTGGWQTSVGRELDGCVLGVLGLGRIGERVARIGNAFGMDVIAWSQNLSMDAAGEAGARYVGKAELFARGGGRADHPSQVERAFTKRGRT